MVYTLGTQIDYAKKKPRQVAGSSHVKKCGFWDAGQLIGRSALWPRFDAFPVQGFLAQWREAFLGPPKMPAVTCHLKRSSKAISMAFLSPLGHHGSRATSPSRRLRESALPSWTIHLGSASWLGRHVWEDRSTDLVAIAYLPPISAALSARNQRSQAWAWGAVVGRPEGDLTQQQRRNKLVGFPGWPPRRFWGCVHSWTPGCNNRFL